MNIEKLQELLSKELITQDQSDRIEAVYSKKIFSVFYELRTILYMGIVLFSSGIGFLIYKNIGQLGHYASLTLLIAVTITCFYHAFKKGLPYSNQSVKSPTPYFDYAVLLGCLLFISVLGYLQFLFGFLSESLQETTLFTSLFFFAIAYRFDHTGVLSLAITAFASFWGIRVSPQDWKSSELLFHDKLYVTAIILGAALALTAILLDWKKIKLHFTFTYVNFASLIFFMGALAGVFEDDRNAIFILLTYFGCAGSIFFATRKKSFLFLLYAFVFGYIVTTYLLAEMVLRDSVLWSFYLIGSCAGFVWFIIRYKNYFKRIE